MYDNKPKKSEADIYEELCDASDEFKGRKLLKRIMGTVAVVAVVAVIVNVYSRPSDVVSNYVNLDYSKIVEETTSDTYVDSSYSSSSSSTYGGSSYSSSSSSTYGGSSYSSSMVTCPSCGERVSSLIRREVIKGNGDWQSWCSSCWSNYDRISPYSNSEETDYDRALDTVSKAYGISKSELDAAYRSKYGY